MSKFAVLPVCMCVCVTLDQIQTEYSFCKVKSLWSDSDLDRKTTDFEWTVIKGVM